MSPLRTSCGMTSQWALLKNLMNSTMSWVGCPVRLMSAVMSSTMRRYSDFVYWPNLLEAPEGATLASSFCAGEDEAVFGCFEVRPSATQFARTLAILSHRSSTCQIWD